MEGRVNLKVEPHSGGYCGCSEVLLEVLWGVVECSGVFQECSGMFHGFTDTC